MPFREIICGVVVMTEQIRVMQNQVAENPTGQVTASPATGATNDSQKPTTAPASPQTPPAQSPAQADTASAAGTPSNAPSEHDPAHPRPLPEGWAPRFWPHIMERDFMPCDKQAKKCLADHTLRLDYEMVLRGGREEVVRVKSELVMPLALELENMAQTDLSFPELFDRVIVRPVVTKFRSFLQKRFDAASAAEAKKRSDVEPLPTPSPSTNIKLPKPANGTSYPIPDMSPKLPTARMPGGNGNLKD